MKGKNYNWLELSRIYQICFIFICNVFTVFLLSYISMKHKNNSLGKNKKQNTTTTTTTTKKNTKILWAINCELTVALN